MTRIVLCLSHSIEEHDQLRLLSSLGYEVFSIGGYIDPAHPHDPKRPALPNVPFFPELKAVIDALDAPENGVEVEGVGALGAAQLHIPDAILDWLGDDGVIIYHHFLERMWMQFPRLYAWKRGKPGRRVVWRSVGQTNPDMERAAAYYRSQGMERVAYSPREANIPLHAGYDALIRFYVDPDEWGGWTGEEAVVTNVTQGLFQRGSATSPWFWTAATEGLPAIPLGEGTDTGILPFGEMKARLRRARAYLYTGTRPASYTLGLIEALMTGIPVVSIGPKAWAANDKWLESIFEAHDLSSSWSDDPAMAQRYLAELLDSQEAAAAVSRGQRARAIETFGIETVGAAWSEFLG